MVLKPAERLLVEHLGVLSVKNVQLLFVSGLPSNLLEIIILCNGSRSGRCKKAFPFVAVGLQCGDGIDDANCAGAVNAS